MNKIKLHLQFKYFLMLLMLSSGSFVFNSCNKAKEYPGYKLLEKRFVKEVNGDVYFFEHIKSGAHLIKIAADDPNKTFAITFKTQPESDCGTPHIIEHSVLNGSKKFPCKSPFDELGKGSLKTFLNAFTGSDFTMYPVASMNNKDFFNLMNVYMDAVFNPLIYSDPRIFYQEGWHYEMTDKNSPLVYKGVVYNEMKGAFSSGERELYYQISKNLFPDNGYHFSSGGYPAAIPNLTYEQFIDFHRRNYSPTNSYIYLYGDADMEKELQFIDSAYLSNFEKSKDVKEIPLQKPFETMKDVAGVYPAMEGSETKDQTYLSLSWVIGKNTDRSLVMALDVLCDVLVTQESAPIRLALEKAGIGKDVSAYNDETQQNVFVITVKNANPEDKDKFKEIVMNTLREISEKGIDKAAIEGKLNRMEFRLREGSDAQKGLTNIFNSLAAWMFSQDPFLGLEWEKPLAEVKKSLSTKYLEEKIKSGFLNNPHMLLLTLKPQPGLEKEINAKIASDLAEYKSKLTPAQIDTIVKQTNQLMEFQKREDSPEALATIPALKLQDVNPKAAWYSILEKKVDNTNVLHYEDFTNNIVYTRLLFDLKALPAESIPYAALLSEVIGAMSTEKYTFGQLDQAMNIHTGGMSTFVDSWLENNDDAKLLPKFVFDSKSMNNKTGKVFELIAEMINKTKYNDKERLKSVLSRLQSRLDNRAKQNGYGYAYTRAASYYSNRGYFNELIGGFEFYWFVNDLIKNFDKNSDQIIANLEKTSKLLFSSKNMMAFTTCSKDDYNSFATELTSFVKNISSTQPTYQNWTFNLAKKNEGFLSASKVQYVIKSYNFKKLGYKWDGRLLVLNSILSSDWLQTRIRVMGGAYGGFSGFSADGDMYFASYRDPNLKETLENYNATPEFLKTFKADDATMLKYIIGTIGELDNPLTTAEEGKLALSRYLRKRTAEEVQNERTAVLSTTVADIQNTATMISDFLKQNSYCVYGNKEKIESQKALFGKLVTLEKN